MTDRLNLDQIGCDNPVLYSNIRNTQLFLLTHACLLPDRSHTLLTQNKTSYNISLGDIKGTYFIVKFFHDGGKRQCERDFIFLLWSKSKPFTSYLESDTKNPIYSNFTRLMLRLIDWPIFLVNLASHIPRNYFNSSDSNK